MSERQRRPSRIPEFSSIQEEAEFWDTHDFTDFLDELDPVNVTFGPEMRPPLSVSLDPGDRAALDRLAAEQGVDPAALVRTWVRERLHSANGTG